MTNNEAVEAYFKAWETAEFNDVPFAPDFAFTGPMRQIDNAKDFISISARQHPR